jgi:hypothetical protein
MKKTIFAGALLIGLTAGYYVSMFFPFHIEKKPVGTPELDGQIVLVNKYPDGSTREIGARSPYDVTGTFVGAFAMRSSPDRTKVAYTTWENAHVVIYVANVDGSGARKIAEQVLPEGSGGLNVSTIRWSDDGEHITYMESGIKCAKAVCINPEDFSGVVQMTYSVDVATGKKTLVPTN